MFRLAVASALVAASAGLAGLPIVNAAFAQSQAYSDGLADRTAYESWFSTLPLSNGPAPSTGRHSEASVIQASAPALPRRRAISRWRRAAVMRSAALPRLMRAA